MGVVEEGVELLEVSVTVVRGGGHTLLVGVVEEGVELLEVSVTVVATAGLCSSLLTD